MSESKQWSTLRDGMGGSWEAERIENRLNTGTPDVAYSMLGAHGWIELKFVPGAPKRGDKPVRIDHFTPDQRNWLEKHGNRGGRCFVLLQVGDVWLMFDHTVVREIGFVPMDRLRQLDRLQHKSGDRWSRIKSVLTEIVKH